MATAKASAEYAQDAIDFARDLAEDGYSCSFGKLGDPVNDYDPPLAYAEIGSAFVFPGEWKADFSSDVRSDDRMFFVTATVDIPSCTHMIDSDGKYPEIIKIKNFNPDGVTVVYYEIQVR